MLRRCTDVGFELFQGYLLGRPQTMTVESLSPKQAVTLQLIGLLANPETTPDQIEEALRRDPGLSLRLLKIINSAGYGLTRRISSIRDAVVMIGSNKLRSWMMLLSLAESGGQQHKLSEALSLARTCEMLAGLYQERPDVAFAAGLLRGIADTLGMSSSEFLRGLPPLAEELVGPLNEVPGPITRILVATNCYLRRDIRGLIATDVPSSDVAQAYLSAMAWSHAIMSATAEA